MKEYNIGLDIGTSSVGWAVVEANNQKIMKKGNKQLWGVRLFSEAETAEERRKFRSARRRYDRRRERIKLLQDIFRDTINKVDNNFFQKLQESKYDIEDKANKKVFISEEERTRIKKYNEKYKTIYHLRKRLVEDKTKADIRLVYMAIHHIIKYRGNFLFENAKLNLNNVNLEIKLKDFFEEAYSSFPELKIPENYEELFSLEKIENTLLNDTKNDVKVNLKEELKVLDNTSFIKEFSNAVIGYKFSVNKMFNLDEKDIKLSFAGSDIDEKYIELEGLLGDRISALLLLKEVYDTLFLKKIFKGSNNEYISDKMVEIYDQHKQDLKLLKSVLRGKKDYKEVLKKEKCLYDEYLRNAISKEEFYKDIEKILKSITDANVIGQVEIIKQEIAKDIFLPRINDVENGKYPYQLNEKELIKIIENQSEYYSFLKEKLDDGTYKIVKLLTFKIPYYVGPLVSEEKSKFAWLVRNEGKEHLKIDPFTFDEIIDKDKTAEKFIKRMVSKCTYLFNELALPNNSILYSEFKVLNELKQIMVNNEKLSIDQVKEVYEELFCKTSGSITEKKFINFIQQKNWFSMADELKITGYSADKKFANNMQSFVDFFGDDGFFENTTYTKDNAEEIIEWITIFEDKEILKRKLEQKYSELKTNNKMDAVLKKKYSGWGSLSRKLLLNVNYYDKSSNIPKSIMNLMYETRENFMQIINNDDYKIQDVINKINGEALSKELSYEVVDELATSPQNKRGIYQSLKVVKELVDYIGYDPKYISIEMSRSNENTGRTLDRKKYLDNLYAGNKEFIDNYKQLNTELKTRDDIDDKVFLYFIQEGKCLYCGKDLNIDDLSDCEVDHIIPRTLIKDNSWDNKALVHSTHNQSKKDSFVVPKEFKTPYVYSYWNRLRNIKLLSPKKHYNLTRKEFSEKDIQGFINRQLVETRQITKHVANILSNYYKESKVIYLKASLSSDYRNKFELFKYRDLNDYHHAHDAYLAAVLGEYKERFLNKKIDFELIKELNSKLKENKKYKDLSYGFVINSLDDSVTKNLNSLCNMFVNEKTGEVIFDVKEFNKNIEDALYRNDIFISRKGDFKTGEFYNQNACKKGDGNIPLKKNMPAIIYGGYKSVNNAYLILVEYVDKKKAQRKLIGVPVSIALMNDKDKNILNDYIKKHLHVDNFKIIKDKIPFDMDLIYNNQRVTLKGYTVSSGLCELANANELKIPKEKLMLWKYTLNKIFNDKEIPKIDNNPVINEEIFRSQLLEIINYLYSKNLEYPLFSNAINNIKNTINLNELADDELIKVIREICVLYKCNGDKLVLSEYGFPKTKEIGRLRKNITSGTLLFKSVTGLKEYKYEVGE